MPTRHTASKNAEDDDRNTQVHSEGENRPNNPPRQADPAQIQQDQRDKPCQKADNPQAVRVGNRPDPEPDPDPEFLSQNDVQNAAEEASSQDSNPGEQDDNTPQVNQDEEWYEAEKLLKSKWVKGKKHFLVQWSDKNAPPSWEPESNITPLLIEQFHINKTKLTKRK